MQPNVPVYIAKCLVVQSTYQVLHTTQVVFNLVLACLNHDRYLVTFSPLADNPEDPQVHCTVNFTVFAFCNLIVH